MKRGVISSYLLLAIVSCAFTQQNDSVYCKGFVVDTTLPFVRAISANNMRGSIPCNFSGVTVIPVVFHVIHRGEPEDSGRNVSDADILAQLQFLNENFRKANVSPSLYPGIAADVGIEFQLARSSPDGLPYPGIHRVNWAAAPPPYPKSYLDGTIKPATIWDPDRYLNIWISEPKQDNGPVIGGYATFPANTPLGGQDIMNPHLGNDLTEGIVINYSTINNSISRTSLTHEAGHYLGLIHIWGGVDTLGAVANCDIVNNYYQDHCGDTPRTRGNPPSTICGNYHTCGLITRDMTENFMDYSIRCHQIFTQDQKARMIVTLSSPRRPEHTYTNSNEWHGLDTYEPNISSTNSANVFPLLSSTSVDSSIRSYIFNSSDYDWFKISFNQPGTLTITLDDLDQNYDLEIYGTNGLSDWINGSYNTAVNAEQIVYANTSTLPNYIYATVYGFNNIYDRCGDYKLRIQWAPATNCIPVSILTTKTDLTSAIANDGNASVTVTSGAAPYAYLWSTTDTTSSISDLSVGTYHVTVTGNDGCSATTSVHVGVQGMQQPSCYGTTTLTASAATFSDGSGNGVYANNSNCSWKIDPVINNATVTLFFSFFQLGTGDTVTVYDGSNSSAPVVGKYWGNILPPQLTSTGPTMFVSFITDNSDSLAGWTANYTSQVLTTGKSIVQYEYWFDDDYAGRQLFNITPRKVLDLNSSVSTMGLPFGLHILHFRFKDDNNRWSSVLSSFFIKYPDGNNTTRNITAYEYWFDDNYINRTTEFVNPNASFSLNTELNVSAVSHGMHTLNVRFKDDTEFWSSVLSSFFIKIGMDTAENNTITAYRYWFDMNHSAMTTVLLPNPVKVYDLAANITTNQLSNGAHTIHFQFKDSIGLWSGVTNDTFNVSTPVTPPQAMFTANDTLLCKADTVVFTNQSTDANTYEWNFGDGGTSTATNPSHTYTVPGMYTVRLIAINTSNGLRDTLIKLQHISVVTPNVAASANASICPGDSAVLSASGGITYSWFPPTGLNATTLANVKASPQNTTSYNVIGYDQYGCADTATVTISVSNVVHVNLTSDTAICEGSSVTLAANGANSYLWTPSVGLSSTTGSSVSASPTSNITYKVVGTASCGTDSAYVSVSLNPLPTANAGNDTVMCLGNSITLVASGGVSFMWSNGPTASNYEVSPVQTTEYTVLVTSQNGCQDDDSVQVIVNSLPVVSLDSFGTICISITAIPLHGGTPSGGTYSGAGISNSIFEPAIAGIGTHPIIYSYSDGNGCTATAQNYVKVDACPGIKKVLENIQIELFPNPTTGAVNISIIASDLCGAEIEVFNELGRNISSDKHSFIKTFQTKYDLSLLPAGIYLFKVTVNGQSEKYSVILSK